MKMFQRIAFLGMLVLVPQLLYAEGTKQWSPSSADSTFLKVNSVGNYSFAGYGVPTNKRLHIHVDDHTSEMVYIGLSSMVDESTAADVGTSYSFQIRSPSGAIVHGPHAVTAPNLTSYAMATAGPDVVAAGGYPTAGIWTFDPAESGDYYIEFSTAASIRWFDITVADGASAIDGRIWSQAWAVRANNGFGDGVYFDTPFNGKLVAYDGKYATQIDFNGSGIRPLEGQFSFNQTGPGNTGDIESDRRSVNDVNSTNPFHKIFLNQPDPSIYPLSPEGVLTNQSITVVNPASPQLPLEVTQPGKIEIVMDFGPGNTRRLFADVVAGVNLIPWDGLDGNGATVGIDNYPVPVSVAYTQGVTHFTAYDVEGLDNGFEVRTQTSINTIGPNTQYWDDSNIVDNPGTADVQVNVDTGATTRRRWNLNDYGDLNTINTWWFAYQGINTTTMIAPGDYGDAPNSYGEAFHVDPASTTVYLGAVPPDVDNDTMNTASGGLDGAGDDNDGTDDEDGISTLPALNITMSSYTLPAADITVANTSGADATLYAFIDFNNNGNFNDPGESASVNVSSGATQPDADLAFTGFTMASSAGTTYARLRITTQTGVGPDWVAADGEVEDYPLPISLTRPPPLVGCVSDGRIFSTGYDGAGGKLVPGDREINWEVGEGTTAGPASVSTWTTPYVNRHTAWAVSTYGNAEWISHASDTRHSGDREYYYRYRFDIYNAVYLPSFFIGLDFTADNTVFEIYNNGVPQSASLTDVPQPLTGSASTLYFNYGFTNANRSQTVLTNDWVHGQNELIVHIKSGNPYAGFMAQSTSDSLCMDEHSDAPVDGSLAPNGIDTTAYGEAAHEAIQGIQLGNSIDFEITAPSSANADGDGSDDDSVSTFGILTDASQTYSVDAVVTNQTGAAAKLMAWIDFDGNGTFDPDEAAIRNVPTGITNSAITLHWSNIPIDIQAGDSFVRLRLTTDSITNSEPNGTKSSGEVEDYKLTIASSGATLSGQVYIDANSNAIKEGGESGIGNTVVVLHNTDLGTCQSIRTNGSGQYQFTSLADHNYELYQADGESSPTPQACGSSFVKNPRGYQSTTPDILIVAVAGSDITDQDFGEVAGTHNTTSGNTGAGIAFEPDHQSEILPNNVVFYAHTLTSAAEGEVSFMAIGSGNITAGWAHTLYYDSDCNGNLNGSEANTPVNGAGTSILAGGRLCIINKVYAPANVPAQDLYEVKTTATFTYPLGSIVSPVTLEVTDVTVASQIAIPATVTTPQVGGSALELIKTVENLTQSSAETEGLNQASPGDVLKYRIYYRNTGSGPINDLRINDMMPDHTGLVSGSAICNLPPAGMTCLPVMNFDKLNWEFTGALEGGAESHVSFEVRVDN